MGVECRQLMVDTTRAFAEVNESVRAAEAQLSGDLARPDLAAHLRQLQEAEGAKLKFTLVHQVHSPCLHWRQVTVTYLVSLESPAGTSGPWRLRDSGWRLAPAHRDYSEITGVLRGTLNEQSLNLTGSAGANSRQFASQSRYRVSVSLSAWSCQKCLGEGGAWRLADALFCP